jgi:hypothetical protein
MTNRKGSNEGVIHTNTYAHLWHASKCVLAVGQAVEAGCTWQFLSSILLTSFAFEAYMNHIGNVIYEKDEWGNRYERKSSVEKLEVIYGKLDIQVHTKQDLEAFQTIIKLYNFRNNIAHENVAYRKEESSSNIFPPSFLHTLIGDIPEEQWEALTSDDSFAMKVRRDVEAVVKLIHKASGGTLPTLVDSSANEPNIR